MKRILLLVVAWASVSTVSAQIVTPTIRLFLSRTAPGADLASVPAEYGATGQNNVGIVPTFGNGTVLHLYAMVEGNGIWVGLGFGAFGASGPLTLINPEFGDPDEDGLPNRRWNLLSDLSGNLGGTDSVNGVAVSLDGQVRGLRHPIGAAFDAADPAAFTVVSGPAGRSLYYLGSATPDGVGQDSIFLTVQNGIVRAGGSALPGDPVYFGFNDPVVLGGSPPGTSSTLPEALIPEPASACLLVCGALLLRRRG